MKKALITGITGQDGSYLAEFLMEKGYEVHGLVRRSSSFNRGRIEHLRMNPEIPFKKLNLHDRYPESKPVNVNNPPRRSVQPCRTKPCGNQF